MKNRSVYHLGAMVLVSAALCLFCGLAQAQLQNNPDPDFEIIPWGDGEAIRGELLVQFHESFPVPAEVREAVHGKLGYTVIEEITDTLHRVDIGNTPLNEGIARYEADGNVDFAEPNIVYVTQVNPNDSYFSSQWGPKKMDCPDAWDDYKGDSNYVVAMVDSGIDMDHPDLKNQYAWGYDYYSGDNNPEDNYGHGTHTAGTSAAQTNNGIGVAGVAWNCKFAAYRVGNYYLSNSAIVSSINDARTKGAYVISMSFGSGQSSSSIQNALTSAYNAGIVNVASAGNSGSTGKNYPAAYSNVIAVASSNTSDGRSSFSNYGNWVDVAAPGENILSTYLQKQYSYMDGTSMSCPHVSGMAVYLYARLGGPRTKANADLVRDAIQDTAKYVGTWVIHGRVDMDAALNQIGGSMNPPTLTGVSPATVQAFQGGTLTLTGTNFTGANKITVGTKNITTGFTVVSDTTITLSAPTATALGATPVTVTNAAGTSNGKNFTYVETSPPKMYCPSLTSNGDSFTWGYGAGVGEGYLLNLALKNSTINFQGYDVLVGFTTVYMGYLNAAGTGELTVTVPSGLQGVSFYSQVLFWDPKFAGASSVRSTLVIN